MPYKTHLDVPYMLLPDTAHHQQQKAEVYDHSAVVVVEYVQLSTSRVSRLGLILLLLLLLLW